MKTQLTDNEIRVRIAEACGWRWEEPFSKRKASNRLIGPKSEVVTVWRDGTFGGERMLPSYLTSLDAMHEAVMSLSTSCRDLFNIKLCEMVCAKFDYSELSEMDSAINATARSRALAFLATITP